MSEVSTLLSSEEINNIGSALQELSLSECKFGYAGSYAREEQSEKSDLDIVVSKNADYLSAEEYMKIYNCINSMLSYKGIAFDILHLEGLQVEDTRLDSLCLEVTGETNEDSVYKTILRDVIWYE